MTTTVSFGELLEATDQFPLEDQEILMDILHRRLIERRRAALAADIQEARREFQDGQSQPVTSQDLMREILS